MQVKWGLKLAKHALVALLLAGGSYAAGYVGLAVSRERFGPMIERGAFTRSCNSVRSGATRQFAMEIMEHADYETASLLPSGGIHYTAHGLECRLTLGGDRIANRSLGRR
jgi:hypothetical protein